MEGILWVINMIYVQAAHILFDCVSKYVLMKIALKIIIDYIFHQTFHLIFRVCRVYLYSQQQYIYIVS